MKKIFIAVMAMAAFAACSNEVEIAPSQGEAIAFGDAYVDNATKAIYEEAEDIEGFTVWGSVEGTEGPVALYGETGAAVTRGGAALGAAWSCNVVRYWTPLCRYSFVAIANGTAAELDNGVPTKIAYTVANDPADLIYGAATATTDAQCVPTGNITGGNIVTFKMAHLLSLVNVSFKNSVSTSDNAYTYEITDVKVTGWEKGIYTVNGGTWAQDGTSTKALSFNGIASLPYATTATKVGSQLIIPNQPIVISFTYNEKINGNTYLTKTIEQKVVETAQNNYQYNITVEFSKDNEINFTVDATDGLAGFTQGSDVTVQ